ncbi:MAG: hypothetical protein AB7T37_15625 [Dehalococcoidia bacterium]
MTISLLPDSPGAAAACDRLEAYLRATGWLGYDPYDALKSPPLAWVANRSRLAGQVATAAVRLSPVNLRPALGVRRSRNAKGTALLAVASRKRAATTGDVHHIARAERLTKELEDKAVPTGNGAGWGYDFPWANRSFVAPAGTPNAVVTCFVLDALAAGGPSRAGLVTAGIRFLRDGLRWGWAGAGATVSYTPGDRREVLNVEALVARQLILRGSEDDREHGISLVRRVLELQNGDGSWPYGTASNDGFIDAYHTGFVLRSLADIEKRVAIGGLSEAVARGLGYFETVLIDPDGAARAGPGRRYPLDVHAWAEAVLAAKQFKRPWLARTLLWGIANLQQPDGAFAYQMRRRTTLRTPYLRWNQAWAYLALADALES